MAGTVAIPSPLEISSSYAAYIKSSPTVREAKQLAGDWLRRNDPDLALQIAPLLASDDIQVLIQPKDQAPSPPEPLLRAMGMGAEEEARYRRATHVVVVVARSTWPGAPLAACAALATAKALASAFRGVVLDPDGPRLLMVKQLDQALSVAGHIAIARFLKCPWSVEKGGAGWLTTVGMRAFGLPNLEMRDVPPDLSALTFVLLAVAQHVLEECVAHNPSPLATGADSVSLSLPEEIVLSPEHFKAAFGAENMPRGQARLRLSFQFAGREGLDPLIEVGPPLSYSGDLGAWYHSVLAEIAAGEASEPELIEPQAGALDAAHERALREWPAVRDRFGAGLAPGQQLVVKHAFEVEGGNEFMWVSVVRIEDGELRGTLMNASSHDSSLPAGTSVAFDAEDIYDWMLLGGARREGGYTDAALRAQRAAGGGGGWSVVRIALAALVLFLGLGAVYGLLRLGLQHKGVMGVALASVAIIVWARRRGKRLRGAQPADDST